jgi:iron-sulfur cluster repair protein YtfE (RIC family)
MCKAPIEHVWDFIGRKINQRNPKCQHIDELRTAILQEWQQFPQERLRRLVRSMTRRVTELHNKRGGYTRKITNLQIIYHPERRDYDVTKMRFKTGAGKT